MTEERRRYPRAEAALNVSYKAGSFGELIRDETVDLSLGGMFIKTTQQLALDDEVSFQLVTDREGGLIEGKGKVVRVSDGSGAQPQGVGLEFVDLQEPSRSMMNKLVELHLRATGTG
jgi:uncharacterized protein (TIGR02266 family)